MTGAVIFFAFAFLAAVFGQESRFLSPSHTKVFGPGLNAKVSTPARTVYIQARDQYGDPIRYSLGKDAFYVRVRMYPIDGSPPLQLKAQLEDRGDGSYGFLFFYNQVPEKYVVEVKLPDGTPVAQSPYTVWYPDFEHCDCPLDTVEEFYKAYRCQEAFPQIVTDFAQHKTIEEEDVHSIPKILTKDEHCLVHYSIVDGKIYAKAYGKYQGFKAFLDDVLQSLSRKVRLPDVEFVLNLGDWPLATDENGTRGKPVISWCGSESSDDMILPTYRLTRAQVWGVNDENPTQIDLSSYNTNGPWSKRIPKVFFRGRDSNEYRLNFVIEHNGTVTPSDRTWADVAISKNEGNYFPNEEARLKDAMCPVQKVNRNRFVTFFRYQYQLNIDGTVAAYRFPALLAGGSTVFKQESPYYEHFYSQLEPYKHYIPIKRDLSDVKEKWEWAIDHPVESVSMARQAQLFARKWLSLTQIYCYHMKFFETYASKQNFKSKIREGMELANDEKRGKISKDMLGKCVCDGRKGRQARRPSDSPDPKSGHDEL